MRRLYDRPKHPRNGGGAMTDLITSARREWCEQLAKEALKP